jgi:hypothetical protein
MVVLDYLIPRRGEAKLSLVLEYLADSDVYLANPVKTLKYLGFRIDGKKVRMGRADLDLVGNPFSSFEAELDTTSDPNGGNRTGMKKIGKDRENEDRLD